MMWNKLNLLYMKLEKSKLQYYAKDLAQKIKEYSDGNK